VNVTELEIHQLELRYEALRIRSPEKERRILASLAGVGQQCPVVVISDSAGSDRFVLLDGYKRLRGLRRLGQDLVRSTRWTLGEPEALVLEHMLRAGDAASPLEEAWLLRELRDRFGLSEDELARRLDRSKSWVSRRLGLCSDLPEAIQALVRRGALGAHAAMRHLLPLARANTRDCEALAGAVAPLGVTSRQLGALLSAYHTGDAKTRELVLESPAVVLRAQQEARRTAKPQSPAERLLGDFEAVGGIARRAHARLRKDAQALLVAEKEQIWSCAQMSWNDLAALWRRLEREVTGDRPKDTDCHPGNA